MRSQRVVFAAYLLVIVTVLTLAMAIGLTHR